MKKTGCIIACQFQYSTSRKSPEDMCRTYNKILKLIQPLVNLYDLTIMEILHII